MTTFGPGDVAANDWAASFSGAFWTNWSTTTFGSGANFRPINIACRWGSSSGATTTGHNDIWDSTTNLKAYTGDFGVATTGVGSLNNAAAATTVYLVNDFYAGGYLRASTQDSTTPFLDGSGGNYAGKSAADATNAGGTTNWAGVVNPGGLGWYVTSQIIYVLVKRAGAMTQITLAPRKRTASGTWVTLPAFVRRAGAWTPLDFFEQLTREERGIPAGGLPVKVNVGEGWESGWIVEGEIGWFGSIDPTALRLEDWTKPGLYPDVPYPAPFTGRYSSLDPEELVHERLYARWRWERAMREGNLREADDWLIRFQPGYELGMRSRIPTFVS